jgi:hypothetical protein
MGKKTKKKTLSSHWFEYNRSNPAHRKNKKTFDASDSFCRFTQKKHEYQTAMLMETMET